MDKLQNIKRSLKRILDVLPIILVFLGLAICAFLIILNQYSQPGGEANFLGFNWILANVADPLARLIFTGLVAALFTRLFGSIGMYRDAIADLFRGTDWINRLDRSEKEQLWLDTTRTIFMPGFKIESPTQKELISSVNNAILHILGREKDIRDYYVADCKYIGHIGWSDKKNGIIYIEMKTIFDLFPYEVNNEVKYVMKFSPTSGAQLDPKTIGLIDLSSNGTHIIKNGSICIDQQFDARKCYSVEQVENIVFNLKLGTELRHVDGKYRIEAKTVSTQKIDEDPVFFQEMAQVVTDIDITLFLDPRELRVIFEEIGVENAFKMDPINKPAAGILKRKSARALLPRQGFAVVIVRPSTQGAGLAGMDTRISWHFETSHYIVSYGSDGDPNPQLEAPHVDKDE